MTTKLFSLGCVLTIITGRLLSPRHIAGVYDILNFMTGDTLFTHQLLRAIDECKPYLLEQFPQLKNVDVSGVDKDNFKSWYTEQVAKYGDEYWVAPLPKGVHELINPLSELAERVHPDKIVIVNVD